MKGGSQTFGSPEVELLCSGQPFHAGNDALSIRSPKQGLFVSSMPLRSLLIVTRECGCLE